MLVLVLMLQASQKVGELFAEVQEYKSEMELYRTDHEAAHQENEQLKRNFDSREEELQV